MKKLLSILGSVGMIGTAGATVVACGKPSKSKEETKEKVAEKLKADIEEAEGLINTNKKEAGVKETLQAAIEKAKNTLTNKDATIDQLKNASSDLRKAITEYNNSPDDPKEATKTELIKLIEQAKGLAGASEKEESAVKALTIAIGDAQNALDTKEATVDQLKEAITKLQSAIDAYKSAPNKGDSKEVAKTKLKKLIKQAQGLVDAKEKETSAVQALDSATKEAQKVLDEPKSNEAQLIEAATKLQAAIKKYNDAKSEDKRSPKEKLQDKIAEANRLIVLGEKTDEAIKDLKNETKIAQTILGKKDVKDDELTSALNKLQTAINAYNSSAEGIGAWLSRLEKQIDAAQVIAIIKGGSKTKAERDAFNKVIDKAKNVLANSKDENEIKAMIQELKKATDEF